MGQARAKPDAATPKPTKQREVKPLKTLVQRCSLLIRHWLWQIGYTRAVNYLSSARAHVGVRRALNAETRRSPPMSARTIILAVTMVLAAMPACAGPTDTGNDLLANCSPRKQGSPSEFGAYANCLGYVRGIADGIAMWQEYNPETVVACIPRRADSGQLRDITLRWIANNPTQRHLSGGIVVALALQEAWPGPCKGKKQ
jgi:hypothetical protein